MRGGICTIGQTYTSKYGSWQSKSLVANRNQLSYYIEKSKYGFSPPISYISQDTEVELYNVTMWKYNINQAWFETKYWY